MVIRHQVKRAAMNGNGPSQMLTVNDPDHGEITISYELVTPKIAQRWLAERNEHNRRINDRHKAMLRRAMGSDEWMLTPDAIAFDRDGQLENGQHRLSALIEAGKSQYFVVIRGLRRETFNITDVQRKRQVADLLDRVGSYVSTTKLGSALRLMLVYRTIGHFSEPNTQYSNAEILEHMTNEPSIEYAVDQAEQLRRNGLKAAPPSLIAALYHIFSEVSPDDVGEFMEKWATGIGINSGKDPVYALRRKLEDPAVTSKDMKAAYAIVAWNAYRKNKPLTRLRLPDEFPKPL